MGRTNDLGFDYNNLYKRIQNGTTMLDRNHIFDKVVAYNNNLCKKKILNTEADKNIIVGHILDLLNGDICINDYQSKLIRWMFNIEKKIFHNNNNFYILDSNIIKINKIYFDIKFKRCYLQAPKRKRYKCRGGIIINNNGCGKSVASLCLTKIQNKKAITGKIKFKYENSDGIINKVYIETKSTLIISDTKNINKIKEYLNDILKIDSIFYITDIRNLYNINYSKITSYEYVIIDSKILYKMYYQYIKKYKESNIDNELINIRIESLRNSNILYLNNPLFHIIKWNRIIIDNFHIIQIYTPKLIPILSNLQSNYLWVLNSYHSLNNVDFEDIIKIFFNNSSIENTELIDYMMRNMIYYDDHDYNKIKIIKKILYNILTDNELIRYNHHNINCRSERKKYEMASLILIEDLDSILPKYGSIDNIKSDIIKNNSSNINKINDKIIKLQNIKTENNIIINILNKEHIKYSKIFEHNNNIENEIISLNKKKINYNSQSKYIETLQNNKEKICPICLTKYYKNLIITKCGHNFCTGCICKLSNYFTDSFECPTCRKKLTAQHLYSLYYNSKKITKYSSKINRLIEFIQDKHENIIILTQWEFLLCEIKKTLNKNNINYSTKTKDISNIYLFNSKEIFNSIHMDNINYIILCEPVLFLKNKTINMEKNICSFINVKQEHEVKLIHLISKNTKEDSFITCQNNK
jgi:hypothetical protein